MSMSMYLYIIYISQLMLEFGFKQIGENLTFYLFFHVRSDESGTAVFIMFIRKLR